MWLNLWSHARIDLGLSSEEFFEMTPRQLDALTHRHLRQMEEREFLFAQLTSCVVNFSMVHPEKPSQAKDFMPSEMRKRFHAAPKRERINRKQVIAETRKYFAALRGK